MACGTVIPTHVDKGKHSNPPFAKGDLVGGFVFLEVFETIL
jgi:hypothetical protein